MKGWAASEDEAVDIAVAVGRAELAFESDGRVELYVTDPELPPRDEPFGYDRA